MYLCMCMCEDYLLRNGWTDLAKFYFVSSAKPLEASGEAASVYINQNGYQARRQDFGWGAGKIFLRNFFQSV